MTNILFYGFQFPHHGRFSAFSALHREFGNLGLKSIQIPFPQVPGWLPGRIQGVARKKWYQANEYRLRAAFNADNLVHYFFPENSLFKAPRWKKDGPLVLSCHQPIEQLMAGTQLQKRKYLFDGLRAADAVILMASCEIDAYRELAPNAEVFCIPHGVDTDFFSPLPVEKKEDGKFRVLTVGNWLRDYELWAKVVERIATQCPEVEFSVLANPDRLAAATANLKFGQKNLRILQGISDEQLREEYRRAEVVFLPLKNAWANNALLEGMACGRPLVATDLPAIREYAGSAARFIEKGSVDAAVSELLRLKTSGMERVGLGKEARGRMEAGFAWSVIARRHVELYERLMNR